MTKLQHNRAFYPMVLRWRWATLFFLMLATWVGCSGSSKNDNPAKPAAGKGGVSGKGGSGSAGKGTGGSSAEGGDAGEVGQGGTVGGSAGKGGGAGRPGVGGAGGMGALGSGGVGVAGNPSAGSAGIPTGGQGGTVPFAWDCGTETYGDGVCHCGCRALDPDCASSDIDECEVCNAPGSCNGAECPGRIDESDTTDCTAPTSGWVCEERRFEDGETCECGCGALDPDCDDETAESCDVCNAFNSCSNLECIGTIDPDDNSRCYHPPGWTCYQALYGDGFCDCGCGVLDIDCEDAEPESCDYCPQSSCTPFDCTDTLLPGDNTSCKNAPNAWRCPPRLYNDGAQCDCGCGYTDPDCDGDTSLEACERCNSEGSCSGQACPGSIYEDDTRVCTQPEPPDGWTCGAYAYGDGYACNCGCGVQDADCRTTALNQCDQCQCGGSCPGLIDPSDTTQCLPAPDGWECNDNRYGDGYCDCGCGIADSDCPPPPYGYYCSRCPEESCANGKCERLDPEDSTQCLYEEPAGWTCDGYFFDGVCDCGCGGTDVDCIGTTLAACDVCNTPGSCSSTACPGTIDPSDITDCEP
jgi:hypothetical protein